MKYYDYNNSSSLPLLPGHKNKKEWQKIVQKAKLFLQGVWTSIYWLTYKGWHSELGGDYKSKGVVYTIYGLLREK